MQALKASFLLGPTASGKTDVCQWIAERQEYDILSADAMMVYRHMDIGTAKPGSEYRSKARYYGLDLVAPNEHFSVGMYLKLVLPLLRQSVSQGRRVIVTGGSGLYIKALTHGLNQLPAMNAELRRKADEIVRNAGVEALREWARKTDPVAYESVNDKSNPRRLVRALEIAAAGRGGLNMWAGRAQGPAVAGLLMPMRQIHERIARRVKAMYAGGLIEEVVRLLKDKFESAPTAGGAIGYTEAVAFLRGTISLEEAMELTIIRTRQLAKRQMTWFRRQANVEWIAVDQGMTTEQIARKVLDCWKKLGPTPIAPFH